MKRFDEGDVVLGVGVLLLSGGAGWVYPPLGLIVPGVVLTYLALFWARPNRPSTRKER